MLTPADKHELMVRLNDKVDWKNALMTKILGVLRQGQAGLRL